MADPQGGSGAAAQPGANPAAQPSQQPASNFIQVDPNEYSRLKRAEEQVRGMTPYYEKGRQLGFNRAEDFDSWAQKQERLKSSGLSVDALIASMENEKGSQQPEFDPGKFKTEIETSILEKAEARIREADSKREHKSALENYNKVLDGMVDELVGKGSEEEKAVWRAVLRDKAETARRAADNLYPQDHPLHGYDWQPLGKEKLAPIAESVKAMRTKIEARRLAEKGAAANQPSATTAGESAGQGKPTTTPDKHMTQLSRDEKIAKVKEHLAKRGNPGSALSSVG